MNPSPTPATTLRYMFSGHAIGAAARFHRLDEVQNLNHVIPTLGASVVPETGGASTQKVENYRFDVTEPRKRCLLSVQRAEVTVQGRDPDGRFETELEVELDQLEFVEKLHIDFLRLHLLAVREGASGVSRVSTSGNKIEGMRLGNVKVKVEFDDEPLGYTGTDTQLAEFYARQSDDYRNRHCWRFNTAAGSKELERCGEHYRFSLVHKIELIGSEADLQPFTVTGNMIYWKGFGRIILGDVHVKGSERKVSIVRLAMGSDAGGSGSAGTGGSNGGTTGG
jgi:hypothetical protein